jgi:hypothetical protein
MFSHTSILTELQFKSSTRRSSTVFTRGVIKQLSPVTKDTTHQFEPASGLTAWARLL